MRKKTKPILLLGVIILTVTILAGCGGDKTNSEKISEIDQSSQVNQAANESAQDYQQESQGNPPGSVEVSPLSLSAQSTTSELKKNVSVKESKPVTETTGKKAEQTKKTLTSNASTSTNTNTNTNSKPSSKPPQMNQEQISTSLSSLVKDGTITQKQADSVAEYLKKRADERKSLAGAPKTGMPGGENGSPGPMNPGQRPNPLSELISNGTITQDQADKIAQVLFKPPGQ